MASVSISKAAELAGISRTSLYRTYIKQGRISVSKDSAGKKCIDTSELLRVFGQLKTNSEAVAADSTSTVSPPVTPVAVDSAMLQAENAFLKQQVEELQQDKAWYQNQVQTLTDTMKRLEAPKHPQHPRLWWQFWK
ncbi:MAG: hypothetical protein ACPGSM_12680 [Thiolinea sp.]